MLIDSFVSQSKIFLAKKWGHFVLVKPVWAVGWNVLFILKLMISAPAYYSAIVAAVTVENV